MRLQCINPDFIYLLLFFKELQIEEINPKLRIIQRNDVDPIYIRGKFEIFNCTECDRKFSDKQVFGSHLAAHLNERPFECWL